MYLQCCSCKLLKQRFPGELGTGMGAGGQAFRLGVYVTNAVPRVLAVRCSGELGSAAMVSCRLQEVHLALLADTSSRDKQLAHAPAASCAQPSVPNPSPWSLLHGPLCPS